MRQLEGEFRPYTLTVTRSDGNDQRVIHVRQKREIGRGTRGTVFEIDTDVQSRDQADWIPARFVLKEYFEKGQAQRALATYEIVKTSGLPTWTTCRVTEDMNSLVMTPGNRFNTLCISAFPQSDSARAFTMHLSLDDLAQIARELYGQARIAADNNIKLPIDAFFFLISPDRRKIEVIIGDFDNLEIKRLAPGSQALVGKNLGIATTVLNLFLSHYTDLPINDPAVEAVITQTRRGE